VVDISQNLERFEDDVKAIVATACDKSYKKFLKENKIPLNNEDQMETEEKEGYLIGDDTKRQMPFTILAAQRTHFKRLVRYIRLND